MRADISRADETREYFFREGCHILEISNSPEDPDVSIARVRVEPGLCTRAHLLDGIAERYLILEGAGEMYLGDAAPQAVGAGDIVRIPDNTVQSIANTGGCDLVFLAICTPRFVESAYHDI